MNLESELKISYALDCLENLDGLVTLTEEKGELQISIYSEEN